MVKYISETTYLTMVPSRTTIGIALVRRDDDAADAPFMQESRHFPRVALVLC